MAGTGLTVAAERHVCGCQRRCMDDPLEPLKSTILTLEGACSGSKARSILALHPAPCLDLWRCPDIQ